MLSKADTQYSITFRTLGAQTVISGSTVSLFPESTPTASIAVDGDGTTYAQQVIEIARQPAIYQQTWSTIANGFNGELALNTTRLLQSLVLEAGQPFYLEVKLNGETVAREVVGMEHSTMPASAFSGAAITNLLDAFAADPTSNANFNAAAWAAEIAAGGTVTSVNGEVGVVVLDMDDFAETATNKILTTAERAEIAANTAASHAAVTVSDSAEIDFTLTGQDITASLIASSIDETKLDASTNASLDLADSASQPGHTHVASTDIVATGTPSATTYLRGDDTWSTVAGGAGGDVVGPASAVDSNFAAFDTTTGKLIKDSTFASADFATAAQGTDARTPTAHAASHTDGTDDIQDATNAVKGLATAAQITALEANTAARHDAVSIAASGGRDYVTISGTQQLTLHTVDLTADVSGDLPVADGGTGASDAATARTNLGVDAAGTDNSTDVTLAGEDFLSLAGQQITANAIDLDNLSATGTPSVSTYLRGDNTWATVSGSGDVVKVGTPVDNEIGVWTGDGTLEGDTNFTWDGSILDITGEAIISKTATQADEHGVEINYNAAGFGDAKALDIVYTTGAIVTGQDEAAILVNIDETAATGGSIFGLEVLTTDGAADKVCGMKVGAIVAPICQESGTFANPTTGTNNTASTDVAAMIDGSEGTNTNIFVADNDFIIIGAAASFTEIEFILQTLVANPGIAPTFAYSTAGAGQFTTFSPTDGTNGFTNNGVVAWNAGDLTGHTTNDDTGTFDIKITRTSNSKGNASLYYAKTAATVSYQWDESGVVTVASAVVDDEAYSGSWDASLEVPTKNAIYDKIEGSGNRAGHRL